MTLERRLKPSNNNNAANSIIICDTRLAFVWELNTLITNLLLIRWVSALVHRCPSNSCFTTCDHTPDPKRVWPARLVVSVLDIWQ